MQSSGVQVSPCGSLSATQPREDAAASALSPASGRDPSGALILTHRLVLSSAPDRGLTHTAGTTAIPHTLHLAFCEAR